MKLDSIVLAVQEVATYQRECFGSEKIGHHDKGLLDFVTDVDYHSQDILVSAIRDLSPGAGIVAEEAGADIAPEGDRPIYIIDPLDGTANYLSGLGFWGVAVGIVEDGKITGGVIANSQTGRVAVSDGRQKVLDPVEDPEEIRFYGTDRTFENRSIRSIGGKCRMMGASVPSALALLGGGAGGRAGFDALLFGSVCLWDVAASSAVINAWGGSALLATGEELASVNLYDEIGPLGQWRNWRGGMTMSGGRFLAGSLLSSGELRKTSIQDLLVM